MTRRRRHYTWAQVIGPLVVLVALVVVGIGLAVRGSGGDSASKSSSRSTSQRTSTTRNPEIVTVDVSDLPAQARTTLRLISNRGPFPFRQDGVVFSNRERRLPRQERGYYHEYTVQTPGSRDRGARRIITGRSGQKWYTADHYRSFVRIRT
jgi:ribonuclease T1